MNVKRIMFLSLVLINFCAYSSSNKSLMTKKTKTRIASAVAFSALVGPAIYNCYQANADGGDMSDALKTGISLGLFASSNVVLGVFPPKWSFNIEIKAPILGDLTALASALSSFFGGIFLTYCLHKGKFGFQPSTNKILTFLPTLLGVGLPLIVNLYT